MTDDHSTLSTLAVEVEQLGPNTREIKLECKSLDVDISGRRIISTFTRRFEGGQYVRISGPNGSGKSTLLGMLSGLIPPSRGTCLRLHRGRDVDPDRELMYVPQYPVIFGGLSVVDNLSLISHRPLREMRSALDELKQGDGPKATLSVIDNFREAASRLSTGQQRVLLFISACLSDAPLVLLDEPYAGLSKGVARECEGQARSWATGGRLVIEARPEDSAKTR